MKVKVECSCDTTIQYGFQAFKPQDGVKESLRNTHAPRVEPSEDSDDSGSRRVRWEHLNVLTHRTRGHIVSCAQQQVRRAPSRRFPRNGPREPAAPAGGHSCLFPRAGEGTPALLIQVFLHCCSTCGEDDGKRIQILRKEGKKKQQLHNHFINNHHYPAGVRRPLAVLDRRVGANRISFWGEPGAKAAPPIGGLGRGRRGQTSDQNKRNACADTGDPRIWNRRKQSLSRFRGERRMERRAAEWAHSGDTAGLPGRNRGAAATRSFGLLNP